MLRRLLPVISLLNKSNATCYSNNTFSAIRPEGIGAIMSQVECVKTQQIRYYAKGKDKKKEKAKPKKGNINENEMAEVVDVDELKSEMLEAVNSLRHDYVHKLSLRSTTGGIDTLRFSYKGEKIDILEVAKINRSNPDLVIIDMTSCSHLLSIVMKVIATSGMNLNPQQDGNSIIIPIPQITQEYKESLVKSAKLKFNKCRDLIKDSQNKYLKIIKNKPKEGLSEDLIHRVSQQVVFMANTYTADAETLFQKKQEELIGQ